MGNNLNIVCVSVEREWKVIAVGGGVSLKNPVEMV
jgi:hypothetical protein